MSIVWYMSYSHKNHALFLQLNDKKRNNLSKQCTKDFNRYFPEEDLQMENEYMKRYSLSIISPREMQIKPQ